MKNLYLILCFSLFALNIKAAGFTYKPTIDSEVVKANKINISLSGIKDKATISFTSLQNDIKSICIIDANGKTLQQYQVSVKKGNNAFPVIDLTQLQPGTFKVTVIAADSIQHQTTFIKF